MIVQVDLDASSNLIFKLAGMQEQGEYCDFTIFVAGYEIKAHKCVLAACCEYFQTSFNFDEASQSTTNIDLTHVGCEPKIVEIVIRSFYTNEVDLDSNNLESILKLVDYFMCDSLRRCVESFMVNTLSFHTAVTYFQLSVQYNLNSKKLFSFTKWLLWYRFHDYFIYQPELLESSVEVLDAFLNHNIFHHCNPLQVVEFLLNNAKTYLTRLQELSAYEDMVREVKYKLLTSLHSLIDSLQDFSAETLSKWKTCLLEFVKKWRNLNVVDSEYFHPLNCHLKWLEKRLQGFVETESENILCAYGEECSICFHDTNCRRVMCVILSEQNTEASTFPKQMSDTISAGTHSSHLQSDSENLKGSESSPTIKPSQLVSHHINQTLDSSPSGELAATVQDSGQLTLQAIAERSRYLDSFGPADGCLGNSLSSKKLTAARQDCGLQTVPAVEVEQGSTSISSLDPPTDKGLTNVIVVLAPSGAMAAQLMAIEAEKGNSRPLLKSPQLELAFFDNEMKTWRKGGQLEFPIAGVMLEKHAWRMAFLNDCLYLFSAVKGKALEFNMSDGHWTHLDGKQLFDKHDDNSPVKSVIPIAVCSKLIVLSMSRKVKPSGTFQTMQHFYEMDPASKTFTLAASVTDDRLDQPITKWTVHGDILITVKASTMMHRKFISVQYIHIYNAVTRSLQTIEVNCAIESGISILTKGNILYLLDKEGWCRSYDMKTSTWLEIVWHPPCNSAGSMNGIYADDVYPALTRVTCQAGSSRWEITTSSTVVNSSMKETCVDNENKLQTVFHPSPPFQFMTAMCPGQMTRLNLDKLGVAYFNYVDNRMLNFTLSNSMDS